MMIKQNRAIIFLFLFSAMIVGFILFRSGELFEISDSVKIETEKIGSSFSQESMGDPVNVPEKNLITATTEDKKNFTEIIRMMEDCFQLKTSLSENIYSGSEVFLSILQKEWGTFETRDDWIDWHFHNREGLERRLRLEVTDSEGVTNSGVHGRDLHLFAVDKEGSPVPLEIENMTTHNPSDEVINGILKEGEIFFKEKASSAIFAQGERLQFIEKNGVVDSIEIHQKEKFFHCSTFKNIKENCVCKLPQL